MTGRWWARQASSQPGATSAATQALGGRVLGVAGEDDIVAVALLLEAVGEEVEHPRERRLGLGRRHPQRVAPHRNAARSRPKKPSSAA